MRTDSIHADSIHADSIGPESSQDEAARPVSFRIPGPDEQIDAYLALIAERPELVADRAAMPIITDGERLASYVAETGGSVGVVMTSPFYLTIIDLLDLGHRVHPYSRMIPATRGADDAVVAFAVTGERDDLAVLLIEQFRHATGRYHLELPRGAAQPGMTLGQTAAAELSEETGYRANRVRLLGSTYTDTGLLTQRMAIHLLTDLTYVGAVREELELIRSVRAVPLRDVVEMAARDEIEDGYLLQALALFRASDL